MAARSSLTIGPLTAPDILRVALAEGADEAVRIECQGARRAHAASKVLAAALKTLACDLVLTGTRYTRFVDELRRHIDGAGT